jgi:hypothetical protein
MVLAILTMLTRRGKENGRNDRTAREREKQKNWPLGRRGTRQVDGAKKESSQGKAKAGIRARRSEEKARNDKGDFRERKSPLSAALDPIVGKPIERRRGRRFGGR